MRKVLVFIAKTLLYLAFLLLLFLLETASPLRDVRVLGVGVELLACVPAAIAICDEPCYAVMSGFAVGVLYDVAGGGIEGLYSLYFVLFAAAAASFGRRYLRRMWPSHLILAAIELVLLRTGQLILLRMTSTHFPSLAFLQTMYAEVLVALLFSLAVYLPCRLIGCIGRERPAAVPAQ